MWPFSCKNCKTNKEEKEFWHSKCGEQLMEIDDLKEQEKFSDLKWEVLVKTPPTKTNLLVASKDFTYFGFLYLEDGWDYSKKINMQGKDKIWATYTNAESIAWWLNLDLIKKDSNERRESDRP